MSKLLSERVCFVVCFSLGIVLIPQVAMAADPLAVDVDLAIWSAVVFLVTLAILSKFAWRPIVEGLDRREKAIADNIATAENAADEARRLTAEYESKLAGAADEVRAVMEEARRDAEYTGQQIVEKAQTKATDEGNRMLREVQTAKEAALAEIFDRAADVSIELAGKIVGRELSPDDHSRMIDEAQGNFSTSESQS